MTDRPRPRLSLSLNGLSMRQLAIKTWKRLEGHDAMIWAAAIGCNSRIWRFCRISGMTG